MLGVQRVRVSNPDVCHADDETARGARQASHKRSEPDDCDAIVLRTLTTYKAKKVAAQTGYDLLKKKSDALMVRFRGLARQIKEVSVSGRGSLC